MLVHSTQRETRGSCWHLAEEVKPGPVQWLWPLKGLMLHDADTSSFVPVIEQQTGYVSAVHSDERRAVDSDA